MRIVHHEGWTMLWMRPGYRQVIYYTWQSVGPSQVPNRSVGPHVPYRDKVHYAKWASTSMEGVETVRVYEECIDSNCFDIDMGCCIWIAWVVFSIGYRWISIIGVKKSVKSIYENLTDSHQRTNRPKPMILGWMEVAYDGCKTEGSLHPDTTTSTKQSTNRTKRM